MKRILFILAVGVIAALFAAPQTFRDLVNRARGVRPAASESTAQPMEDSVAMSDAEQWAPPPEFEPPSLAEPPAETPQFYAPGSVRHNWQQAAEDNPLLADGSVSRLPDLGQVDENPAAAIDLDTPLVESLPAVQQDENLQLFPSLSPEEETDDSILDLLPPVSATPHGAPSPEVAAGEPVETPQTESDRIELTPPLATNDSPPTAPPSPEVRVPVADMAAELDPPPESELPGANLLLFAREMVQLQVWDDWHVSETAAGRDVRLVVSSAPFKNALVQGMWISCHVARAPEDSAALESLLTERVALVTKQRATLLTTRKVQLGAWPGLRADFLLETQPLVVRGNAENRRYDGFHLLVPTPWALVEVHGVSPMEDKSGLQKLEQVLASLRLRAPQPWSRNPTPTTQDAQSAFGVWKSSRGRMRIFDHGRIDIEADRLLLLSSPTSRQEAERMEAEGPPRLRGTYRAEGDVIYITWDDGSRLNLRWKLSKGKLLVTDHQGQISKLKPLIE